MKRCFTFLGLLGLLLAFCPQVGAQQCAGYQVGQPQFGVVPAGVYGQNGGIYATVTATPTPSGGKASHKASLGSGTGFTLTWTTNAPSGSTATLTGQGSVALNGSVNLSAATGSTTYTFMVYFPSGSGSTMDRVTVTGVSGYPSGTIVSQDTLPENFYFQATTYFSGPDVYQACQACIDYPTGCSGVQHTPYVTLHAHNAQSQEDQRITEQAGNVASEYDSLYGSGTVSISLLPGDTISGDGTDEIDCSQMGNVYQNNPGSGWSTWSVEWAWTRVQTLPTTCHYVTGGGVRCNVAYLCNDDSKPPDLRPNSVQTNQYGIADMPSFWLGGSAGFSIAGSPYVFPALDLIGSLPNTGGWWKNFAAPAIPWNGGSFECTNAAKGTGPSIVWPF